jgi:hypothetical protein
LNPPRRDKKIANDSSKTSGTVETPFLESATHKYCYNLDEKSINIKYFGGGIFSKPPFLIFFSFYRRF